jgi:hypothetical protein
LITDEGGGFGNLIGEVEHLALVRGLFLTTKHTKKT